MHPTRAARSASDTYMRFPLKACLLMSILMFVVALVAPQLGQAQSDATLEGAITDSNGTAIGDASVSLYSANHGTMQTTSDSRGRFEFTHVSPGTYKVEAKRTAFQTTTAQPIHIKAGDPSPHSITIKMELAVMGNCGSLSSVSYEERESDAIQLAGEMHPMPPKPEPNVDWPGTPFSDATVEILKADSDQVVASMHPDVHGKFQFKGLAIGQYLVRVAYAGYHDSTSVRLEINSEDVTKVMISMVPLGGEIVCM
jgi:uncharacterized surface anchored protein